MPYAVEFLTEATRRWKQTQLRVARKALGRGDTPLAKKSLRSATVFSFQRRQALRWLREGYFYEPYRGGSSSGQELEDFLSLHQKRFT